MFFGVSISWVPLVIPTLPHECLQILEVFSRFQDFIISHSTFIRLKQSSIMCFFRNLFHYVQFPVLCITSSEAQAQPHYSSPTHNSHASFTQSQIIQFFPIFCNYMALVFFFSLMIVLISKCNSIASLSIKDFCFPKIKIN